MNRFSGYHAFKHKTDAQCWTVSSHLDLELKRRYSKSRIHKKVINLSSRIKETLTFIWLFFICCVFLFFFHFLRGNVLRLATGIGAIAHVLRLTAVKNWKTCKTLAYWSRGVWAPVSFSFKKKKHVSWLDRRLRCFQTVSDLKQTNKQTFCPKLGAISALIFH